MYQWDNFPAPFPIRIPLGLRESGKCGNTETQKARLVTSALREDFFKKSLSLKMRLAEMRNGRIKTTPTVPYDNIIGLGVGAVRPFCRDLYLNFLGCKIILVPYTPPHKG